MTLKQLQARVEALEAEVKHLREQLTEEPPKKSIMDLFGKYANNPAAAEADRLMFEQIERQRKKDLAAFDRREAAAARKKAGGKKRRTTGASA